MLIVLLWSKTENVVQAGDGALVIVSRNVVFSVNRTISLPSNLVSIVLNISVIDGVHLFVIVLLSVIFISQYSLSSDNDTNLPGKGKII